MMHMISEEDRIAFNEVYVWAKSKSKYGLIGYEFVKAFMRGLATKYKYDYSCFAVNLKYGNLERISYAENFL